MALSYESAHEAPHFITRSGWLRAAVLGANDGIVSVSSLIVGVAAADPSPEAVLLAGGAGLAAGAMSMAAGEYVSVSSQSDIERADIARETEALAKTPKAEERELASIFEARGLGAQTAAQVAHELSAKDALAAHVREELGLSEVHAANPLQAAAGVGADLHRRGGRAAGGGGSGACGVRHSGGGRGNAAGTGRPRGCRRPCRGGTEGPRHRPRAVLGGRRHGDHRGCRPYFRGQRLREICPPQTRHKPSQSVRPRQAGQPVRPEDQGASHQAKRQVTQGLSAQATTAV